uniref:Uncharacterized protein n=1 Tax=Scleropages formosus TaxID=113540 RepID=A0A8D0CHR1_SCLFO
MGAEEGLLKGEWLIWCWSRVRCCCFRCGRGLDNYLTDERCRGNLRGNFREAAAAEDELNVAIPVSLSFPVCQEWEKLNYDIHTLKCTRREVSSRWKKILWQMGYQKEADALLAVNRQSLLTHVEDSPRARELLDELWQESGLFPQGYSTPDKYLLIMDRLVSLDSAEEFVELAKKKYPKN